MEAAALREGVIATAARDFELAELVARLAEEGMLRDHIRQIGMVGIVGQSEAVVDGGRSPGAKPCVGECVITRGWQSLLIDAAHMAVEPTEHPLEWARTGRAEPNLLRELVELGPVYQLGRRSDPGRREAEIDADRSGQCRRVAADEDVADELAGNRRELGRPEVIARGQIQKRGLIAELLAQLEILR